MLAWLLVLLIGIPILIPLALIWAGVRFLPLLQRLVRVQQGRRDTSQD